CPPLFKIIQEGSLMSWREMYEVFNMGHRFELYVDPEDANQIISIAKTLGVEAQIIGRVEASEEKRLTIKSEFGIFDY
ncbi:MAG: phosphoribosylformylglycinamidine cyclo-ligase, partial [SAR324 cluster bacterium]|nr:phosphoribosylformylglycinamidine cyclo-ligase [SAR324 cluster bacterium]